MTDEEYQRYEKKAWETLTNFVTANAEELSVIWGWGDGDGGLVLEKIRTLMVESGHVAPRPSAKQTYGKKPIPPGMRTQVLERDAYRCVHCGSHKGLSVDHIFPEALGGEAIMENLQTLCRPCNSVKGKRV